MFIPTPNNPTGNTVPPGLVEQLLDSGALLVLDEAYIEFARDESLVQRAAADPALIVLRTFSKWGGLAGMRIGYAVMHPGTAALFMATKQPYNLSIASETAAIASLDHADALDARAEMIAAERGRVAEALRSLGWVEPAPSGDELPALPPDAWRRSRRSRRAAATWHLHALLRHAPAWPITFASRWACPTRTTA